MSTTLLPSVPELREMFEKEVGRFEGSLQDVYEHADVLMARAVLPHTREVRRGDRIHGGVALRVVGPDIAVHPYVFRQVCRNGAIMAQVVGTRRLVRCDGHDPEYMRQAVADGFAEAIRLSADERVFVENAEEIRASMNYDADLALMLMPVLSSLPEDVARQLVSTILGRFESDGDSTAFGLMNAVTSVARETPDPEQRWRLEEAGGGIPARLRKVPSSDGTAARLVRA